MTPETQNLLNQHAAWLRGEAEKPDLTNANITYANLTYTNLTNANLTHANLSNTNLTYANLTYANLTRANLSNTNLTNANLSGVKRLTSAAEWMRHNLQATDLGYLCYKTFGSTYQPPDNWVIEPGSTITETINPNRTTECGSGINIATKNWAAKHAVNMKTMWECLIKWEDLPDTCVPYMTDGKFRTGRITIIREVPILED